MEKVLYRNLIEEDCEVCKKLIGEAFGFNEFIKDEKFLNLMLESYLNECILESSFSKVAIKDDKVIGLILGGADKDKNRLKVNDDFKLDYEKEEIESLMENVSEENKNVIKELLKIKIVYDEIIDDKNKKGEFQGSIQLFIVSKESRGLGVGKKLLNYLFDYMKNMDVKSLYLYTDTRCNYGFYDSQNFKRLREKELYFDSIKAKLDVFLYGYYF